MSDWKAKMADVLTAGQQPSNDDLEDALAGALTERKELAKALASEIAKNEADRTTALAGRNDLERALANEVAKNEALLVTVKDMATWLGKLSGAFIRKDADKLAETMDQFVKQRVKPVMTKKRDVY
jgi:hypothetical protein